MKIILIITVDESEISHHLPDPVNYNDFLYNKCNDHSLFYRVGREKNKNIIENLKNNCLKKLKECLTELKGVMKEKNNLEVIAAVHFGGRNYKYCINKQKDLKKVIEKSKKGVDTDWIQNLSIVYYSSTDNDNSFVKKKNLTYYNHKISSIENFVKLIKLRSEGEEIKYFDPIEKKTQLIKLWLPLAIDVQGLSELKKHENNNEILEDYWSDIKSNKNKFKNILKKHFQIVRNNKWLIELMPNNNYSEIKQIIKDLDIIDKKYEFDDLEEKYIKKYLTNNENGYFLPSFLNTIINKLNKQILND